MSTTTTNPTDQLSDILRLILAVHFDDPERADETEEAMDLAGWHLHDAPRKSEHWLSESTLAYPDRIGRLEVWRDHCDFVAELGGASISLRARMKGNGLYPVCEVYPQAEGKARHGQIEQLATLLDPWIERYPEWREALQTALQRSGGHWERVLVSWLGAARLMKRGALL